jgi:hypothetical protein
VDTTEKAQLQEAAGEGEGAVIEPGGGNVGLTAGVMTHECVRGCGIDSSLLWCGKYIYFSGEQTVYRGGLCVETSTVGEEVVRCLCCVRQVS